MVTQHTKDMVNPEFIDAVVKYTSQKESKSATNVSCILGYLCDNFDGLPVEAKQIREHHWKPYVEKLFNRKILKGAEKSFTGLLELNNFEANGKNVSRDYEEYVLLSGDFDERVFLSENAEVEIGTPLKMNQLEVDVTSRRNFEVWHLQSLLARLKSVPSEGLVAIFKECKANLQEDIEKRVNELGEQFSVKYTQ
ncbi:Retinoblastoma 1, partial [Paramuricea clavata]